MRAPARGTVESFHVDHPDRPLSFRAPAYAESVEKVPENMQEVRPHIMISVPRLYEKIYARVQEKVKSDSWLKRYIFNKAVVVGKQRAHEKYDLKVENPSTTRKFKRMDRLVYSKRRERTGGRVKFFVSGGAGPFAGAGFSSSLSRASGDTTSFCSTAR